MDEDGLEMIKDETNVAFNNFLSVCLSFDATVGSKQLFILLVTPFAMFPRPTREFPSKLLLNFNESGKTEIKLSALKPQIPLEFPIKRIPSVQLKFSIFVSLSFEFL